MDNLKEFKALIKRYESITIEDIEEIPLDIDDDYPLGGQKASELTNFASFSCSLCKPICGNCNVCVWGKNVSCCSGDNEKTYDAIYDAKSDKGLLKAFKKRAKHMKTVLKIKI